jgi:hypothetical protein
MAYAAADASISWRFALVNSAKTAVKINVNTSSTLMTTPVDEPICDERVKHSKIYTGSIRSAMIDEKLMRDAMISSRRREYRMTFELSGSAFLCCSFFVNTLPLINHPGIRLTDEQNNF